MGINNFKGCPFPWEQRYVTEKYYCKTTTRDKFDDTPNVEVGEEIKGKLRWSQALYGSSQKYGSIC